MPSGAVGSSCAPPETATTLSNRQCQTVSLFYLLVAIMPLSDHHLLGMRLVGGITPFKLIGCACILYGIAHFLMRPTGPSFLEPSQSKLFLAFYLMAALSYCLTGRWEDISLSPLMMLTSQFLLLALTVATVDSIRRLYRVLAATVAGIGLASVYVMRGWLAAVREYGSLSNRPGGASGDSNYFAVEVVICLPIAYYLIVAERVLWRKWCFLGCAGAGLVAVMLASSRGGLLGMAASSAYIVWCSRRRFRNFVILGLLLLPPLVIVPSSPLWRLLRPNYGDDVGQTARQTVWKAGFRMIWKYPLTGVGLGGFKGNVLKFEEPDENVVSIAHNTYIEIAAELGIPGLIVFVLMLGCSYRSLGVVRKRALHSGQRLLQAAASGLQASVVGAAVGIVFLSATSEKLLWLTIGLSMCMTSLVRVRKERGLAMPTTPELAEARRNATAGGDL